MNDKILLEDLIAFQIGTGNINDYTYRTNNIKKIVKNRTTDKIWLLNNLLQNHIIDEEYYQQLITLVKNDYILSQYCILNIISASSLRKE